MNFNKITKYDNCDILRNQNVYQINIIYKSTGE